MSIKKIDQALTDCISCGRPHIGEEALDKGQINVLTRSFVAFACYLSDLTSNLSSTRVRVEDSVLIAEMKNLIHTYSRNGIFYFDEMLTDLETIRNSITSGTLDSRCPSTKYNFTRLIVWDPSDYACLRAWNTISVFLTKIQMDRSSLQDCMYEKYMQAEERAKLPLRSDLLCAMRAVITEWFRDIDLSDLCPNHGGGAVASTKIKSMYEKYLDLKLLPTISDIVQREAVPYYSFIESRKANPVRDYTSRLIFVPKSWKALRTVKPEPTSLMYWQQALHTKIIEHVIRKKSLSCHFPFLDQTVHHKLVKFGSASKYYSTIDLSQASDSVTSSLVDFIFADTPLHDWLMATRSQYTEYNGVRFQSAIFAGMGSCTCFPVETIVFGSICEVCRRQYYATHPNQTVFQLSPAWSVYGDDIIVESNLYNGVVKLLESCNFIVNESKSFHDSSFLESCGVECLDGVDITPLKFKVKLSEKRSAALSGYVALGNRALVLYGCTRLYNLCRYESDKIVDSVNHSRRKRGRKILPYVGTHSSLPPEPVDNTLFYPTKELFTPEMLEQEGLDGRDISLNQLKTTLYNVIAHDGSHLREQLRWNGDYQRWEAHVLFVRQQPRKYGRITAHDLYANCIGLQEALRSRAAIEGYSDPYMRQSRTEPVLRADWHTIG